jgi:hypothetical protein
MPLLWLQRLELSSDSRDCKACLKAVEYCSCWSTDRHWFATPAICTTFMTPMDTSSWMVKVGLPSIMQSTMKCLRFLMSSAYCGLQSPHSYGQLAPTGPADACQRAVRNVQSLSPTLTLMGRGNRSWCSDSLRVG